MHCRQDVPDVSSNRPMSRVSIRPAPHTATSPVMPLRIAWITPSSGRTRPASCPWVATTASTPPDAGKVACADVPCVERNIRASEATGQAVAATDNGRRATAGRRKPAVNAMPPQHARAWHGHRRPCRNRTRAETALSASTVVAGVRVADTPLTTAAATSCFGGAATTTVGAVTTAAAAVFVVHVVCAGLPPDATPRAGGRGTHPVPC